MLKTGPLIPHLNYLRKSGIFSAMIYVLTYSPPADSFSIRRRRTAPAPATVAQVFNAQGPNLPELPVQHTVEEPMRLYAGCRLAVVVFTGKRIRNAVFDT